MSVDLKTMTMAQLRKTASNEGVSLSRDMTAPIIVELIERNRGRGVEIAPVVVDDSRPKPGWARIEIHRDPTPGAANNKIYVGVNGYQCEIARGVIVDVPIKLLRGSLMTARTEVLREDTSVAENDPNRYSYEHVYSYPFTVHDIVEGPDPRPRLEPANAARNGPRKAYFKEHGAWPKPVELRDWLRTGGKSLK